MAIRLGEEAPNFTAETTEGTINFHEWLGGGWGILFSHPKDYTPVCTTELGTVAKITPEFKKRGVKVIGATAHNVTEDLDQGPIIEQDVTRVTHRDGSGEMVRKGQDMEKTVLARAVQWVVEDRILVYHNRTVVFI